MKKIYLSSVLLLSLLLVNCSNDDDANVVIPPAPAPVEENPMQGYLTSSGFDLVQNFVNAGDYEFGLKFKPKVNGEIKKLVVKIPDNQTNLRITLWDASVTPKVVVATEVIYSVSAGVETIKSISPIAVTANKEYMLTMNTNDWYKRYKSSGSATYPIESGNISITGYSWISGTAQTYPTNVDNTYYAGDLSFVFLKS